MTSGDRYTLNMTWKQKLGHKSVGQMKKSFTVMKELQDRSRKCHEFVRGSLLSEKIENVTLQKALKHYFSYWNDFSHPGLFSIASQAVGLGPDSMLQPQAAIAMMAAAFDIHDDIVDKSQAKHGYPTVYGKFGENIALLLGNAFLTDGFTLLGNEASKLPAERARAIFKIIKNSLFEVGNAHALELDLRGRYDVPPEKYLQILEMKSASIEADMHIAALFGTGNKAKAEDMKKYGRALGTLATLREEFIDVFEPDELNQRVQREALPIPVVYALQDAQASVRIRKLLKKKKLTTGDTDKLVSIIFDSKPLGILKEYMTNLVAESCSHLSGLDDNRSKALLENLSMAMLENL